VKVKISDVYFLITLAKGDQDLARHLSWPLASTPPHKRATEGSFSDRGGCGMGRAHLEQWRR
jgi:hypothetical protein